MPYTLAKFALWLIGAALIGVVVGWLLRSLSRSSGDAAAADEMAEATVAPAGPSVETAAMTAAWSAEIDRLRAKVVELEAVAIERDRLKWQLDELRAANQRQQPADVNALWSGAAAGGSAQPPRASLGAVEAERDEWASKAVAYEQLISELRVRLWNSEARLADLQAAVARPSTGLASPSSPPTPDLAAGALVLGPSLQLDDLTVVEGIGPKIAGLCHQRGITTWWALANTDVEVLRTLLTEAGPKFQVHDPTWWPEQARLLATGQWVAFQSLVERLRGGSARA